MWKPAQAVALPSGLASAGITYPLPGGEVTAIEGVSFTVVAAAVVATRQVAVALQDATGADVFLILAPGTQTSGQTVRYSFAPDVTTFGSGALGAMGGPFPRASWADNLTLIVTVAAANAADTITNARLLVRQYERVPDFYAETVES